ncbi:MAG: SDR family NAD(P)-dependent oxidoreductase [Bryobacteraceae bacterium]|nr:SDR family NAD(P)-dependent oxidoreductase [Bryobacteraceae bacterium]
MRERYSNALMFAAIGAGALAAIAKAVRQKRRYDFSSKVVLITGGSRGLGLALARMFANEGARLAICARNQGELDRAAGELQSLGAEVLAISCDLEDRGQAHDLVRKVEQHYGRIDVLVNVAGIIQVGPMDTMTVDDYERAMRVHFWAPLHTILAALEGMRRRGEGRIVNISSIGGKISVPHLLPYCASKFALVGLSEGLRAELAQDGIFVTTVCPGLMRTGSPRNADFKGQNQAEYAWFAISDNLPALSISAEEAARQIVEATRYGEAEIIPGTAAKLTVMFHSLFPGLTADLMGMANLLLPAAGGIGTRSAKGYESESRITQSWLTAGNQEAAGRHNQI